MSNAIDLRSANAAWQRWRIAVEESADAGPLCLALANTRNWRHSAEPLERLAAYTDLVRWARERGLCDEREGARLATVASERPRLAEVERVACIELREAIYTVFAACARTQTPPSAGVATLSASFNAAVAHVELALLDGVMRPQLVRDPGLAGPRLHAALSAIALLTSDRAAKVKECADDRGCGWLFVDTTRNGSRRFCFSNECGNRARQAAFRRRHRSDARGPGDAAPHRR